uniref:Uncharacterized protein n=1 Tax=Monodon monoceros TaxID=40151 RepID=A0A8C6AR11_MONMO
MRRSSRIIQVGTKCHHKYPCKREAEREADRHTEQQETIQPQAEITVMWPQAKECRQPQAGSGKDNSSLEPLEGTWPSQHLYFSPVKLLLNFWPLEL